LERDWVAGGGRSRHDIGGAERQMEALGRPPTQPYIEHIGAPFLAYAQGSPCSQGTTVMRLIFGIVIGFALTVGGAYLADHGAVDGVVRPMVNWDVVAKNVEGISGLARDSWKRIAG
jgi:hypothetical protein